MEGGLGVGMQGVPAGLMEGPSYAGRRRESGRRRQDERGRGGDGGWEVEGQRGAAA